MTTYEVFYWELPCLLKFGKSSEVVLGDLLKRPEGGPKNFYNSRTTMTEKIQNGRHKSQKMVYFVKSRHIFVLEYIIFCLIICYISFLIFTLS